jgi:hypothetical protein
VQCIAAERTKIHDVVAADGTVVDNNVPSPERNSVPLCVYVVSHLSLDDAPVQQHTFFTSKRFLASAALPSTAVVFFAGTSVMSTSAMMTIGGGDGGKMEEPPCRKWVSKAIVAYEVREFLVGGPVGEGLWTVWAFDFIDGKVTASLGGCNSMISCLVAVSQRKKLTVGHRRSPLAQEVTGADPDCAYWSFKRSKLLPAGDVRS